MNLPLGHNVWLFSKKKTRSESFLRVNIFFCHDNYKLSTATVQVLTVTTGEKSLDLNYWPDVVAFRKSVWFLYFSGLLNRTINTVYIIILYIGLEHTSAATYCTPYL